MIKLTKKNNDVSIFRIGILIKLRGTLRNRNKKARYYDINNQTQR